MKIKNIIINALPAYIRKPLLQKTLPEFKTQISGITFRKTNTIDEQFSCLELVQTVYKHSGYTTKNVKIRKLSQHDNPKTVIFMATMNNLRKKEIPIYTASLFPDSSLGIPMDTAFKNEVDNLRKQKAIIAEVGCLASHPQFRRKDKNIPMIMNKLIMEYAKDILGITHLLITVHPKHLKIYEDILLFEQIGKIDKFTYVNNNPAVALQLNLKKATERFQNVYGNKPTNKNLYHFFFGEK